MRKQTMKFVELTLNFSSPLSRSHSILSAHSNKTKGKTWKVIRVNKKNKKSNVAYLGIVCRRSVLIVSIGGDDGKLDFIATIALVDVLFERDLRSSNADGFRKKSQIISTTTLNIDGKLTIVSYTHACLVHVVIGSLSLRISDETCLDSVGDST